MKRFLELLDSITPYVSIPLLLAYGGVLAYIVRLVWRIKDERISLGGDLARTKDAHIQKLESEISALRDKQDDPQRLLSEVQIVRMAAETQAAQANQRLADALERLSGTESELEEAREAQRAMHLELEKARQKTDSMLAEAFARAVALQKEDAQRVQAAVIHESVLPLQAIIAHAENLRASWRELSAARVDGSLSEIESSAQVLTCVLQGWRYLTSEDVRLWRHRAHVAEQLVHPAVAPYLSRAKERGVSVKVKVADGIPQVDIDADAMRLALRNLVDNAIKYTKRGGDVSVSAAVEGPRVIIDVRNSGGIGIPRGSEDRIFEAAWRAANSREIAPVGAGLGLFIARRILRAHGGDVRLLRAGEPTVFRMELPIARVDSEEAADGEQARPNRG